jgi:hypothetical protein
MMDSKEEQNTKRYEEVDLEEELVCSLREINNLKKNNLKQKKQLQKYEEEDHDARTKISQRLEEIEKTIVNLNIQLDEKKRMEEVMRI